MSMVNVGKKVDSAETSLTLLDRIHKHDSVAWARFVEIYTPLVAHWAKVCGTPSASVDDLIQEVWKSVSSSIHQFRRNQTSGSFRAWLWTIARNKARDLHRKNTLETQPTGGTEATQFMQNIPEQEPLDDHDAPGHESLRRALKLIEPEFESHTWQAFSRVMFDGYSASQAAEELDMKPNAVHQARFRILRRLRQEMSGLIDAS
jgi:RNA polymerase sigma-70 factor, ECF subfamily